MHTHTPYCNFLVRAVLAVSAVLLIQLFVNALATSLAALSMPVTLHLLQSTVRLQDHFDIWHIWHVGGCQSVGSREGRGAEAACRAKGTAGGTDSGAGQPEI